MIDFTGLYRQRSMLNEAILKSNLKQIKAILSKYMNLNYIDSKTGQTPLHVSCKSGNIAITKLLVENGACQNIQNNNGWFPIHIASYYGHMEICSYLIRMSKVEKTLHTCSDSEFSDKELDSLSSQIEQETDELEMQFSSFKLD